MARAKFYFSCLLLLAISLPIGAECWQWTAKTLPGPVWKDGFSSSYMAYDESTQEIAVVSQDWGTGAFTLWAYDGKKWELMWDQLPPLETDWHYYLTIGMVYDQNLHALVILSYIYYRWIDNGCQAFFMYTPGDGWHKVIDCFQIGPSVYGPQGLVVTYDTLRKRTLIIGGGEMYTRRPITVEFDGANLCTVYNPPEYTLHYGAAGFNPETGNTVFYGYGRGEFEQLETFEYDGATWMLVGTEQQPYSGDPYGAMRVVSGLSYFPALHSMICVPPNLDSFQTWAYQEGQWELLPTEGSSPPRLGGLLAYDQYRKSCVYWGGSYLIGIDSFKSYETLGLKHVRHCRSLAKP